MPGSADPGFTLIQNDEDFQTACSLGFPLMVKPALEGSSIGMSRADDRDQLRSAWAKGGRIPESRHGRVLGHRV